MMSTNDDFPDDVMRAGYQAQADALAPASGRAGPLNDLANAIIAYAEWCGGVHDDGCPADDTCDCSGKWINDGITQAVETLRSDADLRWTLDNIYTLARRRVRALEKDRQDAEGLAATERGAWGHVLRLCEKAGCQGRGVLRDNGGPVEGT